MIIIAPLAVGGVHTPAAIGLCAMLCAWWFVLLVQPRNTDNPTTSISVPSLAFYLMASVCLLQLIPLPPALHELLSPQEWRVTQQGWQAVFGEATQPSFWRPLSLSPAETADRGIRWLTLGVACAVAAHLPPGGRWRHVLRAVCAAGVLVLLVGGAQQLLGAQKILWIYEPRASFPSWTTFVNRNHAAIFYGLASLCGFALALRSFQRSPREAIAAGLAGVVLMFAMSTQDSVGADIIYSAALVVLIVSFGWWRHKRDGSDESRGTSLLAMGLMAVALVVLVIGVSVGSGRDAAVELLGNTRLDAWVEADVFTRWELSRAALDASTDFALTGAGAGSTEHVLPPYVDWSVIRPATIPTVENEPVEWLLHFGWPIGLASILLLTGYVWFSGRKFRTSIRRRYGMAVCVAVFLGLSALFHFPFFALGIALPAILLLEVALAEREGKTPSESRWRRLCEGRVDVSHRTRWVGGVAGTILLGVLAVCHYTQRADLPSVEDATAEQELTRLVARTPAEGSLYMRLALQRMYAGELDDALRLAEHAQAREPKAPAALLVARIHAKRGDMAAAKSAYETLFDGSYAAVPNRWITDFLVPDLQRPARIADVLGSSWPGAWRSAFAALEQRAGPWEAINFGIEVTDRAPEHFTPYMLVITGFRDIEQWALAEMWARMLIERDITGPDGARPAGYPLLINVLVRQKKRGEAFEVAQAAASQVEGDRQLAMWVMRLRPVDPLRATDEQAEVLQAVFEQFCLGPERGSWRHQLCWETEGWLDEYAGELDDAKHAYRRVARKLDRPKALAQFYARHGRCVELNEVLDGRGGLDKTWASGLSGWDRLTRLCAKVAGGLDAE